MDLFLEIRKRRTWLIVAIVVLFVTLATRGILVNQTDTMIRIEGATLETLSLSPQPTLSSVDLDRSKWNVTTGNADLANLNRTLSISAGTGIATYPTVVVAETTGLHVNASQTPFVYANVTCNLGSQWLMAIGWPGWNTTYGPQVVDNLSRYPYLSAGLETKFGLIWFNANYPNYSVDCTGRPQWLKIDALGQLAKYGMGNLPLVGGIQLKQVLLASSPVHPTIRISSIQAQKSPAYYLIPSGANASALVDGSIVFVTHSVGHLLVEGWFPTRTYVQYSLSATLGTEYAVFGALKHAGTIALIRTPFVFSHSTVSSVGTFVDFVSPKFPGDNVEPLGSLNATLVDGDFVLLFVPLAGYSVSEVHIGFLQSSWSRLPFADFASFFSRPVVGPSVAFNSGLILIIMAVALPSVGTGFLLFLSYRKMLPDSNRVFVLISVVSLLIRLAIAPIAASNDTENFAAVASIYYSTGAIASEWVSLPGFVYIQMITYFPYGLMRQLGFSDVSYLALPIFMVENVIVKLPAIFADIAMGYFIFKVAKRAYSASGSIISGLYLLSPLTIYVSSVYGQFDGIFILLTTLALFYGVRKRDSIKGGVLHGASALVLPVGLAAWIPTAFSRFVRREWQALGRAMVTATVILALGLTPVLLDTRSPVVLTSSERLLHAIPGESVVEGTFQFSAMGITYWSSIGYGLTYRFLLQLIGISAGSLVYPIGAVVGGALLTLLQFRKTSRTSDPGKEFVGSLTYLLAMIVLFQLTYPTIFLQFAVWVVAPLFVLHSISRRKVFGVLALAFSFLAGGLYVIFVDNPIARATGVTSYTLMAPTTLNQIWAAVGLAYSILLSFLLVVLVRDLYSRPGIKA